MKFFAAAAAGLLLTACATTDTSTASATQAGTEAQENDGRICTRETGTGSRLPSRTICRTQEEWDDIRERSQDTTREIQRAPQPIQEGN